MSRLLLAAALLLTSLLPACGDGSDTNSEANSDTIKGDSTGEDPTGGPEAAVTYYRDIKAIFDSKCSNCHSPATSGRRHEGCSGARPCASG